MIIHEVVVSGYRGRVYTDGAAKPTESVLTAAFDADENAARLARLRATIGAGTVDAIVFPTVDHPDVLQVFLVPKAPARQRIFACTILTPARVRALLQLSGPVVEGLDTQVLAADHMTLGSIRDAIESWIGRVFPDGAVPRVDVTPWTAPKGVPAGILHLLVARPPTHGLNPLVEKETAPSVEAGEAA